MTRLVASADFERLLRLPSRARTAHFAMHHLPSHAEAPFASSGEPLAAGLSTIAAAGGERPVDDLLPEAVVKRLGALIPKRHARRAVTRSLLKRQVQAAGGRHAGALVAGLWMVRLRAPFDRAAFPSASSVALRISARRELDTLFQAVAGRQSP